MKLTGIQTKVLSKLIDQYEHSVTFSGKNKVRQSFGINVDKVFPRYQDDSDYDFFVSFNEEIKDISDRGWVEISEEHRRISRVYLVLDAISEIYEALGRCPRKDVQSAILDLYDDLEEGINKRCGSGQSEQSEELCRIYLDYINRQRQRIEENRTVEYFSGDMDEYRDIWKVLSVLPDLENEVFLRDLSVKIFHDSKRLEKLKDKAEGILFDNGEYPEKKHILEEYGIIKIPAHVCVKGNIELDFGGERISMRNLAGDIGLSEGMLSDLRDITVYGRRIVTIENLTSFHRYDCGKEDAAIYLAGYHNRQKREFLKMIYRKYPGLEYCHFGDIDAGGFYIYEHLRRKTGIPFSTLEMDASVLMKYRDYAKKLTPYDKKRIRKLSEYYENKTDPDAQASKNLETLETMLKYGIKLEQEATGVLFST